MATPAPAPPPAPALAPAPAPTPAPARLRPAAVAAKGGSPAGVAMALYGTAQEQERDVATALRLTTDDRSAALAARDRLQRHARALGLLDGAGAASNAAK